MAVARQRIGSQAVGLVRAINTKGETMAVAIINTDFPEGVGADM